ncbi:MAG TPA: STAS domain-containing protein [Burkholderiaceae bacterium]|nr:STAS domain-containing protein [Burkholderiaceae bacterium]
MFKPPSSLTVHNAKTVLQAGLRAVADGQRTIDLTHVAAVDSVAVAILLAWQRAARGRGGNLDFGHLPPNLQSLAQLYGVAALLQAPAVAAPVAAQPA